MGLRKVPRMDRRNTSIVNNFPIWLTFCLRYTKTESLKQGLLIFLSSSFCKLSEKDNILGIKNNTTQNMSLSCPLIQQKEILTVGTNDYWSRRAGRRRTGIYQVIRRSNTGIYTWWMVLVMSSLAMRSTTSFPCCSSLFCLAALSWSLNVAEDSCDNISLACCTRSWALSICKIGFHSLLKTIYNKYSVI